MLAGAAVLVATVLGSPATALADPVFGGFAGTRPATLEMKVHSSRHPLGWIHAMAFEHVHPCVANHVQACTNRG